MVSKKRSYEENDDEDFELRKRFKTEPIIDLNETPVNVEFEEETIKKDVKSELVLGKETCFICCENVPNIVFIDCGHGGVCVMCTLEIVSKKNQCPLCREVVNKIVEIEVEEEDSQNLYRVVNTFYVSSALKEENLDSSESN